MAHNSSNYSWQHRSPQPLHPSTMALDQQSFPQSHSLSSHPGYPAGVGYPAHHPSASPGYYQPGPSSSQYLYSQHSGAPQNRHHPRRYIPTHLSDPVGKQLTNSLTSASIPYSLSNTSAIPSSSPPMQEHLFTSSPPSYMINQSEYYLAQGSSISASSNTGSLATSPQPQPLVSPGTVYSSPDPAALSTNPPPYRVLQSPKKPRCFDHGCNGREFSTFSNLLRHQREKSGVVAKAECPSCGAVFTRTTARNIHVAQGKCKASGRDPSSR
ncbi:hypothetical protein BDW71DRAFT_27161 [Aspergillus fruticulosus]